MRLATTDTYASATSQIIREKKLLEKYLPEGVDVEWNVIASGPDLRDSVVSKKVDIADFALMTYIVAYENDLPLTMLSTGGSTPVNIYSNDDSVNALDEFTDASKIAITNKSTNLHIAFLAYCKEELGDAMAYDNCLSPITAPDAIASLATSKDYNGAIFSFPMMKKAEENKDLKLVGEMADVVKEYNIGSAYVTHSDFIKENSDITDAFLKAQEESVKYMSENKEESAKILAEIYGIDAKFVEEVLEEMPPERTIVNYDKLADLLYEANILTKKPTKFKDIPNYENIPKAK